MDQNLSLYRAFYSVAKHLNISEAAKELYISQPAISKAIKKLEDNLDMKLFTRSSRGVALTEEGQILYSYIDRAFDNIEAGEEQLKKIKDLGIGHIKIGVSTTLCKFVLLKYLKEFITANPHIKITIMTQSSNDTIELLRSNKIDVGLIGASEKLEGLDFYSLGTINDVFVASPSYLENFKLRNDEKPSFKNVDFMLLNKGNVSRDYVDKYFLTQNISFENYIEVTSMDLLIDFAKIGLGVGCVIKELILDEIEKGTLIEVPLSIEIPERKLGFAYNETSIMTEATSRFIDYYKSKNEN